MSNTMIKPNYPLKIKQTYKKQEEIKIEPIEQPTERYSKTIYIISNII